MREKRILEGGRAGGGAAETVRAEEEKGAEKWIDRSSVCVCVKTERWCARKKTDAHTLTLTHTHRTLFHQGQYSSGGQASLTQNPLPQGKASWGFIFSGESVQPHSSRPHTHTYSTLCTLY